LNHLFKAFPLLKKNRELTAKLGHLGEYEKKRLNEMLDFDAYLKLIQETLS